MAGIIHQLSIINYHLSIFIHNLFKTKPTIENAALRKQWIMAILIVLLFLWGIYLLMEG